MMNLLRHPPIDVLVKEQLKLAQKQLLEAENNVENATAIRDMLLKRIERLSK